MCAGCCFCMCVASVLGQNVPRLASGKALLHWKQTDSCSKLHIYVCVGSLLICSSNVFHVIGLVLNHLYQYLVCRCSEDESRSLSNTLRYTADMWDKGCLSFLFASSSIHAHKHGFLRCVEGAMGILGEEYTIASPIPSPACACTWTQIVSPELKEAIRQRAGA